MLNELRSSEVGGKNSHIVTFCLHPKTLPFCNIHFLSAHLTHDRMIAKMQAIGWSGQGRVAPKGSLEAVNGLPHRHSKIVADYPFRS